MFENMTHDIYGLHAAHSSNSFTTGRCTLLVLRQRRTEEDDERELQYVTQSPYPAIFLFLRIAGIAYGTSLIVDVPLASKRHFCQR